MSRWIHLDGHVVVSGLTKEQVRECLGADREYGDPAGLPYGSEQQAEVFYVKGTDPPMWSIDGDLRDRGEGDAPHVRDWLQRSVDALRDRGGTVTEAELEVDVEFGPDLQWKLGPDGRLFLVVPKLYREVIAEEEH